MLRQLGKFEIQRVLGQGGQSTVFLAQDTQLQRPVAIKLLRLAPGNTRRTLLEEARTACRLRHPNIAAVYETGEEGDSTFLVFEYIEGRTLDSVLKQDGPLAPPRAAELMAGVLDALAHAHAAGVIHRDLKPANIMIDREGCPRVMDFGIALRTGGQDLSRPGALLGTPVYMAPEYIAAGTVAPSNDVFAAGLVLYEMLFGQRAIDASSDFEALHRIANDPLVFPPDAFDRVDEVMLDLLAKATARDPALRYCSAAQMQQALQAYLKPTDTESALKPAGGGGTLEFLLRRMQHRSDFPSMTAAMTAVNRLAQTEQGDAQKLAALILKDFALTNKLLRVANSAHYSSGRGGTVSTVSRAIIVLGFDTVRSIAMSLVLFERLQDKKHADALKEEFLRASLTGTIARELGTPLVGAGGAEEYFVCAIFHKLGRLLAHYYLREEALAVEKLLAREGEKEEVASRRVLGISYCDLGVGVARSWGFPEGIIHSMTPATPGRREPATASQRVRLVCTLSSELCQILEREPVEQRAGKVASLVHRYEGLVPLDARQMGGLLSRALDAVQELAAALRLDVRHSALGRQILSTPGERKDGAAGLVPAALDAGAGVVTSTAPAEAAPAEAQALLTAGIQDITQALMDDASQPDLMRIVVETAYRAFGLRRVLLCLSDPSGRQLVARYGLGLESGLERFRFALGGTDLFNMLLARNADLLISDADDPKVRSRLPAWYLEGFFARSCLIMPMRRGESVLGMLYADHDMAGGIRIADAELSLLRALRNQAALALKMAR